MSDRIRRVMSPLLLALSLLMGVLLEYVLPPLGETLWEGLVQEGAVRLAYAGAAGALCVWLGLCLPFRGGQPGWLALAALCTSFAVACNNLPWGSLLSGRAEISADGWTVAALALACFATALFEETLFRAFFFRICLSHTGQGRRGRFLAILLSSAVFGLFHLLNLFAGGNPGAIFLQVGYSFLIGCACASLFWLFGRLTVPVLFHAVYNFCGYLVPRLGSGPLYDAPTILFTVLLALACCGVNFAALWRSKEKI